MGRFFSKNITKQKTSREWKMNAKITFPTPGSSRPKGLFEIIKHLVP